MEFSREPKHFSTVVVGLRVTPWFFEADGLHVPSNFPDGPSKPEACPIFREGEVALEGSLVEGNAGLEPGPPR